jgi:hypothetical protein
MFYLVLLTIETDYTGEHSIAKLPFFKKVFIINRDLNRHSKEWIRPIIISLCYFK